MADGRLDAYLVLFTYPWDMAAGALLVEEAGGRVTDFYGEPAKLDEQCILVSNGHLHQAYIERTGTAEHGSLQRRVEAIFAI